MKTILQKITVVAIIAIACLSTKQSKAQATCGAGFTKAAINWDWQYFKVTNLPTSPLMYMFGKNNVRFSWRGTGTNTLIALTTVDAHTGSVGSMGAGNDIGFRVGNGSDTLVFDQEVTNLSFSVYDVDSTQALNVSAFNAANVLQNVTLTRVAGTSLSATVTSTNPTITSNNTRVPFTSNTATVNVTIPTAVNRVILRFTKSGPAACFDTVFISDISACNNNTTVAAWPTNYQAVNTPEAGQPSFTIAAYKDSIMVVDLTNNTSSLLYRDLALTANGINSLAIDPYNQQIYYTDNVRIATNRSVFKYDVKTGVRTTWIADVRTFGILLNNNGLGSGAASFYDGALFLGQDAANAVSEGATVYKIDINPSTGNATRANRYWSKWGASGAPNMFFDWSDYVINDGILYNFNNARGVANRTSMLHFDLNTMDTLRGYTDTARAQVSLDYTGAIWHMLSGSRQSYNTTTGAFGAPIAYSGTTGSVILDSGESFKYPYDYGDAPVGYGVPFHLYRTTPNLMLGAVVDYQSDELLNSAADADDVSNTGSADDEEAVTTFPSLTVANASYTVSVGATNSTGASATLYGYLDFNRDGDFADAGERSAATTVANGATPASPVNVTWSGLTGGSVGASYIRFRIATSAAEAGNRSGYAATGEAEDYPIPINASSLPVELVNFTATAKENNTTQLDWSTASELNNDYFEIQRTQNNSWETIGNVDGNGNSNHFINYLFIDNTPYTGINYYRLKQVDFDGETEYSQVVSVKFDGETKSISKNDIVLFPNPAKNEMWIKAEQEISSDNALDMEVFNLTGEKLYVSKMQGSLQKIDMSTYQTGMYFIKIGTKTYRVLKE